MDFVRSYPERRESSNFKAAVAEARELNIAGKITNRSRQRSAKAALESRPGSSKYGDKVPPRAIGLHEETVATVKQSMERFVTDYG